MGDAKSRLMKDGIRALDQFGDQVAGADVALDQPHALGFGAGEVFRPAADHVVDYDDLAATLAHEVVDNA